MLLRIANLHDLGEKADALQQAVLPGEGARTPGLLQALGNYLRNPGLDNIPEDGWFELLLFAPREDRLSQLVVAFPVKETQTYIRLLSNRPSMSSQIDAEGIIHLREQEVVSTDLYLCATSKRIAIFGSNRAAVTNARLLYEKTGDSLAPNLPGDVNVYLHQKRFISTYVTNISTALKQLQRDFVADLSPGRSGLTESASRVVGEALANLKNLGEEISKIHLSLEITNRLRLPKAENPGWENISGNEVLALAEIDLEPGNISRFLHSAVPRQVELLKFLPPESIACEWSSYEANGWAQLISGITGSMETGFNEPLDPVSQEALQQLLSSFLDLGITEVATATVAPPEASPDLDYQHTPSHFILAALTKLADFKQFLNELENTFAAESPVVSFLNHSGMAIKLERKPCLVLDHDAEAISFTISISGKEEPGEARPIPLVLSGSYLVLLSGNLLVCATGPQAEILLKDYIASLNNQSARFATSPFGMISLQQIHEDRLVWAGMLAPLPYLKMAMGSTSSISSTLGSKDLFQNREGGFSGFSPRLHNSPFIMMLTAEKVDREPVARVAFHLPYDSLRLLLHALLTDTSKNE
ncbi:MAG: hypothetical protein JXA52_09480 [Planctomycetes bacterium]|nr:hypothetical protein [Planctomycetota bacterium]